MPKQQSLKPYDVVVALRLAQLPEAGYAVLATDLRISQSTAHESVERLQFAGLLRPDSRRVIGNALIELLEHGVRYMFPTRPGALAKGVPTAHSGPPLAGEIVSDQVIVWPDPSSKLVGASVTPLYEKATALVESCPSLYEMLTLVDALRIGRVRERVRAIELLAERLTPVA